MSLAQCDDMVDALATDCSDQPLGDAVLPRQRACREYPSSAAWACRTRGNVGPELGNVEFSGVAELATSNVEVTPRRPLLPVVFWAARRREFYLC
jgi:hypothetical protein